MFEFLKTPAPSLVFEDETGTYADALLQVPDVEAIRVVAREYGHEAHRRDYGDQREVARSSLGFA